MNSTSYTVYLITCLVNDKHYVGFTHLPIEQRFRGHQRAAKHGSQFALHCAMRKHSVDNFVIKALEVHADRCSAAEAEKRLIFEHNSHVSEGFGYNMTSGGEGVVGLSPESVQKMAQKHRRENLKRSTIEAMRVAKLGKKLSQETCKRMSTAHTGKTFSDQHRKKIGEANSGERCSAEKRANISKRMSRPVQQISLDGTLVSTFSSMKIASQATNINATNISGCCCGTRKQAGGFAWRYLHEQRQ